MFFKIANTIKWVWNHPVSKGRQIRSVFEFILRQTASRLIGGAVVVDYPSGARLLVPVQMKGSLHYIWPGLFQFEDMSLVIHFLRRGDVFGDVGANIGAFTVLASRTCGAKSIAFEPGVTAFNALADNVAINGIQDSVVLKRVVVGRSGGVQSFLDGTGTESRVAAEGDRGELSEVPMVCLDEEAPSEGFTILKIDTEGFEFEVISGASKVICNPKLKIIILERAGNSRHYNVDEAIIDRLLTEQGFQSFEYSPWTRKISPAPTKAGGCIIYVRDMEFVSSRISSAPQLRFNHLDW